MGRLSPFIQAQLSDALMTLLKDDSLRIGLSDFSHCLLILDLYKREIPHSLLNELHGILRDYVQIGDRGQITSRSNEYTDEQWASLNERLLSIYVEINGGSLIF